MSISHASKGFSKIGIVLVVAVLLVLGGGAYYFMNQQDDATIEVLPQLDTSDNKMENADGSATGSSPESLAALFSTTDTVTCTYTMDDGATEQSEGQIFISGENMRGTFSIDTESVTTTSNIIRNGNKGYVWSSDSSDGYMMDIQDPEELLKQYSDTAQISFDTDDAVSEPTDRVVPNITCEPWDEDASVFEPPSSVNFISISQQMEQMQSITNPTPDGSNEELCASCEQVPDAAAKAQCLQALGC